MHRRVNRIWIFTLSIICLMMFVIPGCGTISQSGSSGGLGDVGTVAVPYQDNSFTVEAMHEVTLTPNMRNGAVLEGYFTIRGGNDDINFAIEDPQGNIVLSINKATGRYDFSYTAPSAGFYTMHFDNTFSLFTSKQIYIHYRVR